MFPKSLIRSNLIVGLKSSKSRIPAVCPLRTDALRTASQGISSSTGKENSKNPFLNLRSRISSPFHFQHCLLIVQLVKLVQPLNLQTPISLPGSPFRMFPSNLVPVPQSSSSQASLRRCVMLRDAQFDKFAAVYIVCGHTDLRYGIDSLAAIIETRFHMSLFVPNTLFLFCGGRADRIKPALPRNYTKALV